MQKLPWIVFYFVLIPFTTVATVSQVIEVEIVCPGVIAPRSGNAALAYHGPAFEAGVELVNKLYSGIFNFTLTFVMGDERAIGDNGSSLREESANVMAQWYYRRHRNPESLFAIITPGRIAAFSEFHKKRC